MGGKGVFGGKRDMYYNENNNTSLYIHPTLIFFSIVRVCMRCVCVFYVDKEMDVMAIFTIEMTLQGLVHSFTFF